MTIPPTPTLSRALSLGGAAAISTGLAFAAINFLGMAQLLDYVSGPMAWLPILAGGALMLGVRAVFSELNDLYPSAAGIRLWMTRALNDRLSLIITLTYTVAIVLVIAADAFIIGEAIAHVVGNGQVIAVGYVGALIAIATWLNLKGIKLAGAAEKVVTTLVVLITAAVGVLAILHPSEGSHGPVGGGSPLQALVLGIFLFTAFEWVTTSAEEVVQPKIIPRAMLIALLVLVVCQTLFTVGMGLTLGADDRASAYPQLIMAKNALGDVGMLVMLGVTALTAVNTFNGGFVTLSRFVYAIAREGKLPRPLTRLNDRAVPVVPVVLLGVLSLVFAVAVALTGTWEMVVSVCAALEMMIYAAASFVVWRLRRTEAGRVRGFRLIAGRPLAMAFTVLFGLLALAAGVTVGPNISPAPLVLLAIVVTVVCLYVFRYVPRLERREAEELAARRAARAAARAQAAKESA